MNQGTLRSFSVTTVVNAAPAMPVKDDELFQLSDIFCVNETEVGMHRLIHGYGALSSLEW